ncbi:MAG: FdtA/QdtA family cupin domain-containing protein [Bacteroidales bacterium]|nr:FdtA/QdtA family cupin domain-containing protein [Bacteroidales bacterium]
MEKNEELRPLPPTTVDDCRLLTLPRRVYPEGAFTIAENGDALPFAIKRIFYIYDIPTDTERGGHAHWREGQIIVAVSGCFDLSIYDGCEWRTFTLRRPYEAVYVPAGLWNRLSHFSAGCVCLVLCSTAYDANDYLRDWATFERLKPRD